jgi:Domain of unknown function (DUF5122) beta-propeller
MCRSDRPVDGRCTHNPYDTSVIFTLCRLDAQGAIDRSLDVDNIGSDFVTGTFPYSVRSRIQEVTLQPDGKILISGNFTHVAGVTRKGMARIIAP